MAAQRIYARPKLVWASVATLIGGLAMLTLVLVSPLLLGRMLGTQTSWVDLANIGQAYGGPAAAISALALLGIAAALTVQWRQMRVQQIFAIRERHFELLKLSLEYPDLRTIFVRDYEEPAEVVDPRILYLNLFLGQVADYWDLGEFSEDGLRQVLREDLFGTHLARTWWLGRGLGWSPRLTRRRLRFHEIANEICHEIEAAAASLQPSQEAEHSQAHIKVTYPAAVAEQVDAPQ